MADLKTFAEQLVNLSVKEVSELADILKNEYGIEPAATAVAAPAAAGAGAAGDAGEEKSEFDVVLTAAGGSKLAVVKLVKELVEIGKNLGCYRITLFCDKKLIKFYERNGFKVNNVIMKKY